MCIFLLNFSVTSTLGLWELRAIVIIQIDNVCYNAVIRILNLMIWINSVYFSYWNQPVEIVGRWLIVNCMFFVDAINVRFGISFHCLSVALVRYHYNTIFSLDHFLFAISYSIYWKYWKYWICVVLKYFVHILFTIQLRVRVYGSLFASPFVTICVCVNRMPIKSCHACALQSFAKRQKS